MEAAAAAAAAASVLSAGEKRLGSFLCMLNFVGVFFCPHLCWAEADECTHQGGKRQHGNGKRYVLNLFATLLSFFLLALTSKQTKHSHLSLGEIAAADAAEATAAEAAAAEAAEAAAADAAEAAVAEAAEAAAAAAAEAAAAAAAVAAAAAAIHAAVPLHHDGHNLAHNALVCKEAMRQRNRYGMCTNCYSFHGEANGY